MAIKRVLFLLPVAVALLFVAAFLGALPNFDKKVNQLVLSSIGDAEKLNPILSVDSASSDINGFIFNGLVKFNENLEMVADLAERWTVRQVSRIYLRPQAALSAQETARRLNAALEPKTREDLQITEIRPVSEREVEVLLDTAGTAVEEFLVAALPKEVFVPLTRADLDLSSEQKVFKGPKELSEKVRQELSKAGLSVVETKVKPWGTVSLRTVGEEETVRLALRPILEAGEGEGEEKTPAVHLSSIESFPIEHRPVITFSLRPNVRWHDGEPFTSKDVEFTFLKVMDPGTNTVRRPMFELVDRLETPDPHTVRVTYWKPFAPSLESWAIGVIPEHLFRDQDINTSSLNRNPVGTGPFKFKVWEADEVITLVANPDYFEGAPNLRQLSYRIIPEPPLKELEFFIEGVDLDTPQPHQYHRYITDERFKVYERLGNGYTYIGYNLRLPLFQDVRVRQALTHAIDREAIVKFLLFDLGVPSTGPFPPQFWYSPPDVKPLPYDPEKAGRLLDEAGWRDTDGDGLLDKDGEPFRFTLMTNNGNNLRINTAVLVQRQLEEIGIDVKIELFEWSVFIRDKVNPRNFEAVVLGWGLGLDPDVYEIWHSSQTEKGFNFVGYRNPEVDRLIEAGRTTFDREERTPIYWKIHELIHEDQPYTFLYVGKGTPALHEGKFRLKRSTDRQEVVEDITMTENGLLYFFKDWFRVRGRAVFTSS